MIEKKIPNKKLKGLYFDNIIVIDKEVKGKEYNEVLAEEIGHHYTSAGNILDYKKVKNIKQEVKARRYGIELIVTLDGLIEAWRLGLHNLYEVAEHFEVRQSYVLDALNYYKVKYNNVVMYNGYRIKFDPLHIMIYKKVK